MQLNIKQRFAALFLCSALVPLALVSLGSFVSAKAALDKVIQAELTIATYDALENLEQFFDRMLGDLNTWSGLRVMQDALVDDDGGEIAAELGRLRQRYPYFANLIVFNSSKDVIASTNGVEVQIFDGAGFLAEPLAGRAFQAQVDVDGSGRPGFIFALPIRADYDQETLIGVLVGVVDWREVEKKLASISFVGAMQDDAHILALLAQRSGEVLYQTGSAPQFDPRSLLDGADASGAITTETGDYLVHGLVSEGQGEFLDPKWTLVTAIDKRIAFADVDRLRWHVVALSMALIGLALGVARLAANDLVAPIASLIAVMRRLAAGDNHAPIPALDRNDEIGAMAEALAVFKDNAIQRVELIAEREAATAKALDESETRFRDMAEAASDWLWETDAERRWTYVSERLAALVEVPIDALVGRPVSEILTPADGPDSEGWARIAARLPFRNVPCLLKAPGGPARTCRLSGVPLFDEQGNLHGYRGAASDVTTELEAQARANHMALHDALTDLPNRSLLSERLEQAMAAANRSAGPVTVLCLDLDRFKEVNDSLGHAAGDTLLRTAADRLRHRVRDRDTVARVGGDEFSIVQVGTAGPADATNLCERLIEAFEDPFNIDGTEVSVGVSIGVAIAPADGKVPADILKNADIALYRAKQDGRGTFRFFEPGMDAELQARRALEHDLRAAIEYEEMHLAYQPQFDVVSMRMVGVEALLRWNHASRGAVSPDQFIPLSEATGLILPLGAWVLRTACWQAAAWPEIRIAVNVSPVQFRKASLIELVRETLEETGLDPDRLELEVTESVLIDDDTTAIEILTGIKDLGVRIALDDFGTGYSSLGYLQRFPFDKIKIDRSFTSQLEASSEAAAIIRAVVALGRGLDMLIVAEGVETATQMSFLTDEHCDHVQGYLLGRPSSAAAIDDLVAGTKMRVPVAGFRVANG